MNAVRPLTTALAGLTLLAVTACGPATQGPSSPTIGPPTSTNPRSTSTDSKSGPTSVSAASGCRVVDGKADRRCTPGALNPQVTQLNIGQTICRSGWTATVRPPESYTEGLKRSGMAAYGETGPLSSAEEDHLIALSAGGSPTDPRNLWPQPYAGTAGAYAKDTEERGIQKAICNGRMTLAEGQAQLVRDWTHS